MSQTSHISWHAVNLAYCQASARLPACGLMLPTAACYPGLPAVRLVTSVIDATSSHAGQGDYSWAPAVAGVASKGEPGWAAGAAASGGWDAEQQPQRAQHSSGWDAAGSQPQPQQQQYGDQSSGWEQQGLGGGGGWEAGASQQPQDAQYAQQPWPETSRVRQWG